MKSRAARLIGAGLLTIGVLMGVWGFTGTATAGTAAQTNATACVTTNHANTDGIVTVPGGYVSLTGDGVQIHTPDTPAKVSWKRTFSSPMDADEFLGASYVLTKLDNGAMNAAALPAFHIYVKVGSAYATLVYEPYYQIVGNPATNIEKLWVVNATSKFWTSSNNLTGITPEAGGSYAGNKTWAQINAANPTLEIVGYGWGQGTYNAGTISLLNDVNFLSKKKCEKNKWSTRFVTPSSSSSSSTTQSASASASASNTVAPSGTTTLQPVAQLPVTGDGSGTNKPLMFTIFGVMLGVLGVGFVWVGRRNRRRVQFRA